MRLGPGSYEAQLAGERTKRSSCGKSQAAILGLQPVFAGGKLHPGPHTSSTFLPSAEQSQGRANHWLITEPASHFPAHQAARPLPICVNCPQLPVPPSCALISGLAAGRAAKWFLAVMAATLPRSLQLPCIPPPLPTLSPSAFSLMLVLLH